MDMEGEENTEMHTNVTDDGAALPESESAEVEAVEEKENGTEIPGKPPGSGAATALPVISLRTVSDSYELISLANGTINVMVPANESYYIRESGTFSKKSKQIAPRIPMGVANTGIPSAPAGPGWSARTCGYPHAHQQVDSALPHRRGGLERGPIILKENLTLLLENHLTLTVMKISHHCHPPTR